jgi:hypothetical protein
VLAGAGFGDDALFTHALYQQALAEDVIDLVRAGMIQVFAFEPDLCAAELLRQASQRRQRRRPTAEFLAQGDVFLPESRVVAQAEEHVFELG